MVEKYTSEANGKVILFGEHFVVHGIPAIAASIENVAIIDVEPSDRTTFTSDVAGTIPELTSKAIENVKNAIGTKREYAIRLRGNLPTFGGLGSSAAFCVALARAIAKAEGKTYTQEEINRIAYEGEKAFHGNPSGIDNTLATYGGIKKFVRGRTPSENRFYDIIVNNRMNIVVSYSGVISKTAKMIANVQTFKDKHPFKFKALCKDMEHIINEAEHALETNSMEFLGELMNKNQELLRLIGVSAEVNDTVVSKLRDLGALGAKLTGGGGGGTNIALFKTDEEAKMAADMMNEEGYTSFATKIPYMTDGI